MLPVVPLLLVLFVPLAVGATVPSGGMAPETPEERRYRLEAPLRDCDADRPDWSPGGYVECAGRAADRALERIGELLARIAVHRPAALVQKAQRDWHRAATRHCRLYDLDAVEGGSLARMHRASCYLSMVLEREGELEILAEHFGRR